MRHVVNITGLLLVILLTTVIAVVLREQGWPNLGACVNMSGGWWSCQIIHRAVDR